MFSLFFVPSFLRRLLPSCSRSSLRFFLCFSGFSCFLYCSWIWPRFTIALSPIPVLVFSRTLLFLYLHGACCNHAQFLFFIFVVDNRVSGVGVLLYLLFLFTVCFWLWVKSEMNRRGASIQTFWYAPIPAIWTSQSQFWFLHFLNNFRKYFL